MKRRSQYILYFLSLSLFLSLIIGCSQDKVFVYVEDDLEDSLSYDNSHSLSNFTSIACSLAQYKVYSFNNQFVEQPTKYAPINKGIFTNIFVYHSEKDPSEMSWDYMSVYIASKIGVLYPIYDRIKLKDGNYRFYALSTDATNDDKTPVIIPQTGLTQYLYNGETYYWWKSEVLQLSHLESQSLVMKLAPVSALLRFEVLEHDSDRKIKSLSISAPTTAQCTLSISSGMISPATSTTGEISFSVTENVAQISILPLVTYFPLALEIVEEHNGKLEKRTKRVRQPKGNLFQGGYQYNYIIDLKGDTIIPQ